MNSVVDWGQIFQGRQQFSGIKEPRFGGVSPEVYEHVPQNEARVCLQC